MKGPAILGERCRWPTANACRPKVSDLSCRTHAGARIPSLIVRGEFLGVSTKALVCVGPLLCRFKASHKATSFTRRPIVANLSLAPKFP